MTKPGGTGTSRRANRDRASPFPPTRGRSFSAMSGNPLIHMALLPEIADADGRDAAVGDVEDRGAIGADEMEDQQVSFTDALGNTVCTR
jgi:hypothetical protein